MKYDISKFRPCSEAVNFYNSCETTEEAWETCQRGEWMLWIARKIGVDLQTLTLAKAVCANTVRHLMKDKRSKDALLVAIKFGRGKATREELNYASVAAYAAADAADAASVAAYAAADAADAASVAAAAAYAAAASAYAVADAAYAASYADGADGADGAASSAVYTAAKNENQLKTANICRKILTDAVFEIIWKGEHK